MNLQLYFRAVSHLSDARFASAAGAEFLGFPWYPSNGDGISRVDYTDIRQWISGPTPVLQIHAVDLGHFAAVPIKSVHKTQASHTITEWESAGHTDQAQRPFYAPDSTDADKIVPDALEVTGSSPNLHGPEIRPTCPIFWKIDTPEGELPELFLDDYDYLLLDPGVFFTHSNPPLTPNDLPKSWAKLFATKRCFLEIPTTIQNPMIWIEMMKPHGVSLSGQAETAVGKRDYSSWQDFTDLLEEAGLR